ncbi:MAG TPA: YraN family protein [Blastocatellia bacterium]|nr:YraN family protein [Blastocatellia bacterium]
MTFRSTYLGKKLQSGATHIALGEWGEHAAVRYLEDHAGYRIVATGFRVPLGRALSGHRISGEIDIIAYDEGCLVFVEVKTRTSTDVAAPERAVDLRKQRQIARAAGRYRRMLGVADEPYRYDVVTVVVSEGDLKVELLKSYFDDRIFSRARYFKLWV